MLETRPYLDFNPLTVVALAILAGALESEDEMDPSISVALGMTNIVKVIGAIPARAVLGALSVKQLVLLNEPLYPNDIPHTPPTPTNVLHLVRTNINRVSCLLLKILKGNLRLFLGRPIGLRLVNLAPLSCLNSAPLNSHNFGRLCANLTLAPHDEIFLRLQSPRVPRAPCIRRCRRLATWAPRLPHRRSSRLSWMKSRLPRCRRG